MKENDFTYDPTSWPAISLKEWAATYKTLHMWTQIVGKLRLELCPLTNHWWEVPLYVNSVGLTTSPMPYGKGVFEVQFDFIRHHLSIQTSEGANRLLELSPKSVAAFYGEVMGALRELDIGVKIWTMPVEVPDPIAFEKDTANAS